MIMSEITIYECPFCGHMITEKTYLEKHSFICPSCEKIRFMNFKEKKKTIDLNDLELRNFLAEDRIPKIF